MMWTTRLGAVALALLAVGCGRLPREVGVTPAIAASVQSAAEAAAERPPTAAGVLPGSWPQWRGPARDAHSPETGLLETWPADGLKLLWSFRECGKGFAGPAVFEDRLVSMGADPDTSQAFVFCVNAATGESLWKTPITDEFTNPWGDGPRGTPTIYDGLVYAIAGGGRLVCLELDSGAEVWTKHLVDDFGGGRPYWGYSESPLVDGDKVMATPGDENCIVALDRRTGETVWVSSGLNDAAQYSSLVRHEVGGIAMYVTMTKQGVVAVAADDGRFLWRYEKTANGTAVCPTPVCFADYVYSTSGYGTGCGLVQLAVEGQNVTATEVYFDRAMKNHHGGVLLHEGHIYGYSDGGGWLCQDVATGEVVWNERRALTKGSIAYADGRLYCYGQKEGTCVLAGATTEGWVEHGRFQIPETTSLDRKQGQVWTHPVIANGTLLLRDQDLLYAFDIREE